MTDPKLSITLRNTHKELDRLQAYKTESEALEAKYQHFISEMIMLRLFSIFESAVAEIAYKIAAGATYLNGSTPALIVQANNMSASRGLFLNHGRVNPVQNLKWSKAKYIRESVQHVIPATEKYITNARFHGSIIDEMRKVRNVLAHNSSSAKTAYRSVIRQTYGANINLSTGAFLASTRRNPICNLNRYLSSAKIIISDMVSGN